MAISNTRIVQIVTNANPFRFIATDKDLGQVQRIHLKSLVVANTEYNINSKSNILNITATDMLPLTPIPLGQYNILTLIDAIKLILNTSAAPNTFNITQDNLSKKLTFVKSGGSQFTIGLASTKRVLGVVSSKVSVNLSLTLEGIPDLSGLRLVVMQSYGIGKFLISQGDSPGENNKNMIIGSIPMNVPFGGLLKFESTESTLNSVFFSNFKNISNFDMLLTDANGAALELNGTEFIISFEAHMEGTN